MRPLALGTFIASAALACGCSSEVPGTGGGSGPGSATGAPSQDGQSGIEEGQTKDNPDGQTGPSEFDPLFEPPTSSDVTSSLTGLWAGTTYNIEHDVRLKVSGSSLVIAVRCRSEPAVGMTVTARVTPTSIRVLESKSTGAEYSSCSLKVRPLDLPKCESSDSIGCFALTGTTLTFQGEWLFTFEGHGPNSDFTKLSD